MSFFYLTLPKGAMPIDLLETIVNKRLEYLKSLHKSGDLVYNEYMIDGSVYDTVAHFMMCLITILEDNPDFTQFFISAEVNLFKHRLKALVAYDVRCFAKRLLRHIRKLETDIYCLDALRRLCQHLLLKPVAHHICSNSCTDNCSVHYLKVFFKHCYKFIAKRDVELKQGFAYIPCSKWKSYLILLFEINLKKRISNKNLDILKHDPRINNLLQKVKRQIPMDNKNNINLLRSQEVDKAIKFFPPCMINLHQYLRKKHRLSHAQRFYYSLFLKDIGMPINEAIIFWRAEYQLTPNGKHNCCHNWEKDEKRFMYGIRHLYGLEGGRRNYYSKSCQHIQESDTSCSEGGCPFKSFDDESILKVLSMKENDTLFSQIKMLQINKKYTSACMLYLQKKFLDKFNYDCDNISFNLNPVNYFTLASTRACI